MRVIVTVIVTVTVTVTVTVRMSVNVRERQCQSYHHIVVMVVANVVAVACEGEGEGAATVRQCDSATVRSSHSCKKQGVSSEDHVAHEGGGSRNGVAEAEAHLGNSCS